MRNRVLIIANPCSGKGKAKKHIGFVSAEFCKAGYTVKSLFTKCVGDATTIVREYGADSDLIVCLGGDGTVNEVVTGLLESNLNKPIGYIPLGCTNDFARSMKISKSVKNNVKQIINGSEKKLDVCRFGNKYFVYVAGFGLFAKSSCTSKQGLKNKFGYLAYVMLGSKEIWHTEKIYMKLRINNEIVEGDYLVGAFCNTKSIAGIIKFSDEEAQMNDGKFEVLLVEYPKSFWALLKVGRAFKKRRWRCDGLTMKSARSMEILETKNQMWSLDGEYDNSKAPITVDIIPGAITIIC